MMNKAMTFLLLFTMVHSLASAAPIMKVTTLAVEGATVRMSVDGAGSGAAEVAPCPACTAMSLQITLNTRFTLDGMPTTASTIDLADKFVTVIYDPAAKIMVRLAATTRNRRSQQ